MNPPAAAAGALGAVALVGLALGRFAVDGRPLLVNESRSLPRGLYVRVAAPVHPGRVVALDPPATARGYLASLGAPANARLLKRVVAMGGETVCADAANLRWPGGRATILARDRTGRRLPSWRGCRRLARHELLVLGDSPTSFDGRYFGPVPLSAVEGVYRELRRW